MEGWFKKEVGYMLKSDESIDRGGGRGACDAGKEGGQ